MSNLEHKSTPHHFEQKPLPPHNPKTVIELVEKWGFLIVPSIPNAVFVAGLAYSDSITYYPKVTIASMAISMFVNYFALHWMVKRTIPSG